MIGIPVKVNEDQMKIDKETQAQIEMEYDNYGDILQVNLCLICNMI